MRVTRDNTVLPVALIEGGGPDDRPSYSNATVLSGRQNNIKRARVDAYQAAAVAAVPRGGRVHKPIERTDL